MPLCVCTRVCTQVHEGVCVCVRAQVYLSQVVVCGWEFRCVCVNAEAHGYINVDL